MLGAHGATQPSNIAYEFLPHRAMQHKYFQGMQSFAYLLVPNVA